MSPWSLVLGLWSYVCPLANDRIKLSVKGEGIIAGVGNGNPQSMESFQSDHVDLFYGKAMVILRGTAKEGNIELTATAKGLIQDIANIKLVDRTFD